MGYLLWLYSAGCWFGVDRLSPALETDLCRLGICSGFWPARA